MSTFAALGIEERVTRARSGPPARLAELIASYARKGSPEARDLTPVLACYWQSLPGWPADVRAQLFQRLQLRVRRGDLDESACMPFALGDPSAEIVAAATAEYVGTRPVSVERRAARVAAAIDWIRRALALNRAAVFAALLALHDEAINAGLRTVCLLLDEREAADVRRQVRGDTAPAVAGFLQDWQELIDSLPRARLPLPR